MCDYLVTIIWLFAGFILAWKRRAMSQFLINTSCRSLYFSVGRATVKSWTRGIFHTAIPAGWFAVVCSKSHRGLTWGDVDDLLGCSLARLALIHLVPFCHSPSLHCASFADLGNVYPLNKCTMMTRSLVCICQRSFSFFPGSNSVIEMAVRAQLYRQVRFPQRSKLRLRTWLV